jgi:probable F420-dependent oxidoreductase
MTVRVTADIAGDLAQALAARDGVDAPRTAVVAAGMLRFGTALPGVQQIPGRGRAWERELAGADLLAVAQAAEAAGFAWVSCSDHVAVPASRTEAMGAVWYDAGSTLAFVAGATSRLGLLSHVVVLPYRHPLVVAKQYGTLDRLSGGRVILGVGSGHLKPEFRSLGADFERRGQVTDEYLQAIDAAWTHDVASFAGATVAFRDVAVAPRPVQRPRPPIWVGGNSRAAVRRAARLADGWIPWEIDAQALAAAAAWARDERARAGRQTPLEVVAPLAVGTDVDAEQVRAAVTRLGAAGATAIHVGIAADGLDALLARLDWLGREVIGAAGA